MDPKSFRRKLRKNQTHAETVFWQLIRTSKFLDLKFRRQHTIGRYTVDFYCPKVKLIVELDGSYHDNVGQSIYDHERDEFLKAKGYRVIRLKNDAVLQYPEVVLEHLKVFLGMNDL